jgi:glucan biosynthesis protein C
MPRDVLLIVVAASAGAGVAIARGFFDTALEPVLEATPFCWVARITFNYMPFYFIGVLMFAHAPVYRAVHRPGLLALMAGAVVFAVLVTWLGGDRASGVAQIAFYAAKNFVIVIVLAALFAVGEAVFSREMPVVSYLGERIYTGYIVHFAVIYMLATGLKPLGLPSILQYALIVCGVLGIAFWMHGHVIVRSLLLQLLFNGKPLGRRAQATPPPTGAGSVA